MPRPPESCRSQKKPPCWPMPDFKAGTEERSGLPMSQRCLADRIPSLRPMESSAQIANSFAFNAALLTGFWRNPCKPFGFQSYTELWRKTRL
jgi:hypothetical protein